MSEAMSEVGVRERGNKTIKLRRVQGSEDQSEQSEKRHFVRRYINYVYIQHLVRSKKTGMGVKKGCYGERNKSPGKGSEVGVNRFQSRQSQRGNQRAIRN
jgi:hypothetical protein